MKVNDYVRYKRPFDRRETIMIGKILRIYEPDEKHKIKGYDLDTSDVISDEFSIKSSPNIIDLIEVGDYVNGYRVLDIAEAPKRALFLNDISQKGALLPRENIKSIVTKETFESKEYRIGE